MSGNEDFLKNFWSTYVNVIFSPLFRIVKALEMNAENTEKQNEKLSGSATNAVEENKETKGETRVRVLLRSLN